MIYIYDVLLNFNKNLYEFFEWEDDDNLLYVKKIPVVRINSKTIYDMIDNKIKVDDDFLGIIKDKTKLYEESEEKNYKYVCIFSDGFISLAVNFINGKSVFVSKMLLDEEKDVFNSLIREKEVIIKYTCLGKRDKTFLSRKEVKEKELIKKELCNIYTKKESNILKYLYLEYFEEDIDDIELIYKRFIKEIDNNYNDKFNRILDLIKLINA